MPVDDSDIVNKRQVKISDHGLFYHDGPYVSHTQVQRMSPLYEDSYDTPVTKTQIIGRENSICPKTTDVKYEK